MKSFTTTLFALLAAAAMIMQPVAAAGGFPIKRSPHPPHITTTQNHAIQDTNTKLVGT